MNGLGRSWALWIVRGIASIMFGAFMIVSPRTALAAIVLVYGVYALADGAVMLGFAFRHEGRKAGYVVRGLVSIAAGLIAIAYPGLTAVSLYILIGAWALVAGVVDIVTAIMLRKETSVGWLVSAGILSLVTGATLLLLPVVGVLALMSLIAAYAILHGGVLIGIGMRIHKIDRTLSPA